MTAVTFEVQGGKELLNALQSVQPMIHGRKGYPQNILRTAVRKATVPIVDRANANAQAVDNPETATQITGTAGIKIIGVRERDAFTRHGDSLEAYDISFGRRQFYFGFVELGTDKQAARPILRPALEEGAGEAINVITSELDKGLQKIAAKLNRESMQAIKK